MEPCLFRHARSLEDDVELVLLLHGLSSATGATGNCNGHRGSSGYLKYFFELLYELAELDQGQLLESFNELVGR